MAEIDETWGYGPESLYLERWKLIFKHLPSSQPFTLIDWGSDGGWFSIRVAHDYPMSEVISVEAGIMTDGSGLNTHRRKRSLYGVESRNLILETLFGPSTFVERSRHPVDYQLVLSVFHHVGDGFGSYLRNSRQWDESFSNLVAGATVTFIEMPNEHSSTETPHRIRRWYSGRPVEEVIETALNRGSIQATVTLLGEVQHGSKGPRKMFMIHAPGRVSRSNVEQVAEQIRKEGEAIRIRPLARLRLSASRRRRRR